MPGHFYVHNQMTIDTELAEPTAADTWQGLSANTEHITEKDDLLLGKCPHIWLDTYANGHWVRLPDELWLPDLCGDVCEDMVAEGMSNDFMALLQFAVELKCRVINIDIGAAYIPELNRNDW